MSEVADLAPRMAAGIASPVDALTVSHVSHAYGSRQALRDVSLKVPQSRFTALLGLNGAGKTTLFSLITRLYDTRHGSIEVLGHPVSREPGQALRLLGVVFQARTLDLDISVTPPHPKAAGRPGSTSPRPDPRHRSPRYRSKARWWSAGTSGPG